MTRIPTSTTLPTPRRRRERDAFSDQEAAKMLGIPVTKLYRICEFFDAVPDDPWELIEGEFFEYEPGQDRKRRFYEEGVMAIATYLEETEGGSFLAKLKEFFTHHHARVTLALVHRRIIQVTQDHSALVIRGDLLFLQQRSVVRVLGTNGKGMAGTVRRIQEESAGLEGAEGLEINVHFADIDSNENSGNENRHWSQRGIARLARTMQDRGRITKARKAWVKAVADGAEDCFEVQRKMLESHEARVRAAMERARSKAKSCAVTQQKPTAADRNPIELEVHHLFDASSRPDLAVLEDNLLVISSALHRNFHKWMANRPCEPKDFVDYLQRNELTHFEGSASTVDEQWHLRKLTNDERNEFRARGENVDSLRLIQIKKSRAGREGDLLLVRRDENFAFSIADYTPTVRRMDGGTGDEDPYTLVLGLIKETDGPMTAEEVWTALGGGVRATGGDLQRRGHPGGVALTGSGGGYSPSPFGRGGYVRACVASD